MSVKMCAYYQKGMCTKKSACPYRHGDADPRYDGISPPASDATQRDSSRKSAPGGHKPASVNVLCTYFARGKCDAADGCRFRHGEKDSRFLRGDANTGPAGGEEGNTRHGDADPRYDGISPPASDATQRDSSRKTVTDGHKPASVDVLCTYFARGRCDAADGCRFRHGEKDARFLRGDANTGPAGGEEGNAGDTNTAVAQAAKYFNISSTPSEEPLPAENTNSPCRESKAGSGVGLGRGSSPKSEVKAPVKERMMLKKLKPCRNFATDRHCAAGSACAFAHGDDDFAYVHINKDERTFMSALELTRGAINALRWHQSPPSCRTGTRQPDLRWCTRDTTDAEGCKYGKACFFAHANKTLRKLRAASKWLCPACAYVNGNDPAVCGGAGCQMERPDVLFPCDDCGVRRVEEDSMCPVCRREKGPDGSDVDDDDRISVDSDVKSVVTVVSLTLSHASSSTRATSPSNSEDEDDGTSSTVSASNPRAFPANMFNSATHGKRGPFNSLPILAAKDTVVSMLYERRVIICKAETGSGKTTQLPQYFADALDKFPKMVVCTQPRQLAAVTISQRVEKEYEHLVPLTNSDGQTVTPPHNQRQRRLVSFLSGNTVKNLRRISFMTEESLIRLCSTSSDLADVSVLIIDEAHERNLNTDIVLGIAKQLLKTRNDFYVVVASATIDETKFLRHFEIDSSHVLSVKGRTFPVTVEHVPLPVPPKSLLPAHADIVTFLMDKLPNTEMHTLVFLPTQRDIELCIRTFMSHPRRSPAWVALPLFGQMSNEEQGKAVEFDQDPHNKGKRMVAFSTNVAETSLTLPGIKLVVDTGLQNYARFDPIRRLNVLELTHVSQSSADQRKGRAGRVSAGHCVRLFDYDKCESNSVPEILRSSLDLVCLRICSLPGQNPTTFPFIEAPPKETVDASLRLLADLQCVDPVTSYSITDKGRAFFALPFDPRWSEFVYTATRYDPGLREEAITVAALQCAPGNLFFFGKTAEDKKERKKMIVEMCRGFPGDVRFLTSVYKTWKSKTQVCNDGSFKCSVCSKPTKRKACDCQKKFAVEQSLNQKVLDAVQNTVAQACQAWKLPDPPPEQRLVTTAAAASSASQTIVATASKQSSGSTLFGSVLQIYQSLTAQEKTSSADQEQEDDDHDDHHHHSSSSSSSSSKSDWVAKCLMRAFPEQICFVPLQHQIQQGLVTADSAIAQINESSVFMHNIQSTLVPAVFVSKITNINGRLTAEGLEPVRLEWSKELQIRQQPTTPRDFAQPVLAEHFGPMFQSIRYLPELRGKCIVGTATGEDNDGGATNNLVQFYAKGADAAHVVELVKAARCRIEQQNPVVAVDLHDGALKVTLKPGLKVDDIIFTTDTCKVMVKVQPQEDCSLPSPDKSATDMGVDTQQELAGPARYVNGKLQLTFKNARFANAFIMKMSQQQSGNAQDGGSEATLGGSDGGVYKPGVTLVCQYTSDKAIDYLKGCGVDVNKISERTVCYVHTVRNLSDVDKASLIKSVTDHCGRVVHNQKGLSIYAHFPVSADLSSFPFGGWANVQGNYYGRLVVKGVSADRRNQVFSAVQNAHGLQGLTFENASCTVGAPKNVSALVWDSALRQLRQEDGTLKIEDISTKYTNSSSGAAMKHRGGRCMRIECKRRNVSEACEALDRAVASARSILQVKRLPLAGHIGWIVLRKLRARTDEELRAQFAALDVHFPEEASQASCGARRLRTNLAVSMSGLPTDVAEFAKQCWDMWADLQNHSRFIPVTNTLSKLLKAHGAKFHNETGIAWDANMLVVAGQTQAEFEEAYAKLAPVMAAISSANIVRCSACSQHSQMLLHRCGHAFCNSCLVEYVSRPSVGFPLVCPSHGCGAPLCREDILDTGLLSDIVMRQISSPTDVLRTKIESKMVACPRCMQGVLNIMHPFSACTSCKETVCTKCFADTEQHKGLTCAQLKRQQELLKNTPALVADLQKRCRDFIRCTQLPAPLVDVQDNPCLVSSCGVLRSFMNGLQQLSSGGVMADGCFAFHGTRSIDAVKSICHGNLDVTRRAGQARGPGEYFGVTSQISHSYGGSTGALIVFYLLSGHRWFTHCPQFCYVVNNPSNEIMFCLPVCVVHYGHGRAIPNWFPCGLAGKYALGAIEEKAAEAWSHDGEQEERKLALSMCPFRFRWEESHGQFFRYPEEYSRQLNIAYEKGEPTVLKNVVRFLDDRPQDYRIDFKTMTQMNTVSRWVRNIDREMIDQGPGECTFEYLNEHNAWVTYDTADQAHINRAFNAYRLGGPGTVSLHLTGRPELYRLNFAAAKQTNMNSNTDRPMRRR